MSEQMSEGLAIVAADRASQEIGAQHRARFSWSGIVAPIIGFGVFIGLWYLMHYWALEALFDKPSFLITEP
ncbi:MAG TPA: hypothetical protein VFV63_11340, partial [Ilumatobacteraceae bacterium]|nr:hypothetical protein [Ilumatobacteraceae bacterium]